MHLAIVSDTHNRYATVEKVLAILSQRKVSHVLHCGDIEDADTVWLFHGLTAHFVLGNCDTERLALQQAIEAIGATLYRPFGQLELEGVRIAFLHGDDARLLSELEHSGEYDFLFHGHTHRTAERQSGPTRVINPGALHRANPKAFALLDLPTGAIETIEVP